MTIKLHTLLKYINRKVRVFRLTYRSYEEQVKHLESYPQPKDAIERSFFQYKCQKYLEGKRTVFLLKNIVSAPLVLFYLFRIKRSKKLQEKRLFANVFVGPASLIEIIPEKYSRNSSFYQCELLDKMSLNDSDRNFLYSLMRRYPFSCFFVLKVLLKLAHYSSVIDRYEPQNILASCEYSFTSSILTYYCKSRNVKHINFMHGEKLFDLTDAFCCFSKFYVWDSYYIDLFKMLRSETNEYLVEIPSSFLKRPLHCDNNFKKMDSRVDFKFYLTKEDCKSLEKLSEVILKLQKKGKNVKIRPHPSFANSSLLYKHIGKEIIEAPSLVDINDSIDNTEYVVSIGSSVLFQAYLRNVQIVIDDITNIERFLYFKNNKHIMYEKEHLLLTEVIDDVL